MSATGVREVVLGWAGLLLVGRLVDNGLVGTGLEVNGADGAKGAGRTGSAEAVI